MYQLRKLPTDVLTVRPDFAPNRSFATVFRLKQRDDDTNSFLFDDFRTSKGEVVNPYHVLKVRRSASRQEIKRAYFALCRKYHPDSFRQKQQHTGIWPGSCNNLQDVHDHWERVKVSYEILSDRTQRRRFDRSEAVADPGAALQRAAVSAVSYLVAQGVGSLTEWAVQQQEAIEKLRQEQIVASMEAKFAELEKSVVDKFQSGVEAAMSQTREAAGKCLAEVRMGFARVGAAVANVCTEKS